MWPCYCRTCGSISSLGVIITGRKLIWVSQVQYVKYNSRKLFLFLSSFDKYCLRSSAVPHTFLCVQSLLQYVIFALGGYSYKVLESLVISQKTMIKVILGKRYSSREFFKDFLILNIWQLFLKTLLIYGNANPNKMFTEYIHQYLTRDRHHAPFVIPKPSHTTDSTNSYLITSCISFTGIPPTS